MVNILQKENSVLRQTAAEVPLEDITSPKIQKIVTDMKEAMHEQDDAVAIAAPQIGMPLRVFVVSGKIFTEPIHEDDGTVRYKEPLPKDLVFINPEIIKRSKDTALLEEGCLSVRWQYGDVHRAKKATVRAYDETGTQFTRGGSGLLAQIFQHEIDHLDGVLFIDKAENLRDMPPQPQPNQSK